MDDATARPEFTAIERIAARLAATGAQAPPGELWIGDDAAVVTVGPARIVVSADALVAGVHADLNLTSLADLGWKALAVNVSDLAAMGCLATRAVVTISAPQPDAADGLYEGLAPAAEAFGCPIVGGDLTAAPVLVVSVTVLGDAGVSPAAVTRSGARPGDELWVTRPLGAAAAGLRMLLAGQGGAEELIGAHARPWPRQAEGTAARELGATAMIDVSDGLWADLGHILDRSGVGAELSTVPVAGGATIEEALGGGDDYELLWSCPPGAATIEGFIARGLPAPHIIGQVVADPGCRTLDGRPFAASGWNHWR